MTDEEREKKTRIANMLIGTINVFEKPILMNQIEKDVTKEALENYIKMLEQTEQEEAEEKQEEKKTESIEDKTWLNFNSVLSMRSYYEKALEDITKEPIPPCFNSICDPKFLNFVIDGLEDAMAALTMLYKNILERSGTHGE